MKEEKITKELRIIINSIKNYTQDEFELYYETDVENTLNDLIKLLRRIENE